MANPDYNPPVTDGERQRVVALHGEGKGRNEIARDLGRAPATITKIAHELDLSFDRHDTGDLAEARRTRSADLKERRQRIQEKMLVQAEGLLDELAAGTWQTILRGSEGREEETILDFVPVRDRKDAVWAVGTYLANDERLERANGDSGVETAKSVVGTLMEGLRTLYRDSDDESRPVEP
ncbi:helix-turn-helix domain-containing protein [Enterococcus hirae]|uniref:helix-turn-helix domain-containing protein n=1 Tax=Enterococcus hirae TaxID=1354 RepID=UPI00136C0A46|nr:helix-turn-helix domain-containing protein [Enterococcus hirae]NAE18265.1 hypothetical protein [Enterococcus hirae]